MAAEQYTPPPVTEEAATPLAKLSASDFRMYNRMAEAMDYFVSSNLSDSRSKNLIRSQHNHFRSTWKQMYEAASSGKRPRNVSLRQFILTGLQFCRSIEMHHGIEEQHVFPMLAKKMPEFRKELHLLTQHKAIHKGIDKMEAYLQNCNSGETDFRMDELKAIMDSYGDVLWAHLDEEVQTLGAENMRKYWTIEEMRNMPM
ncbi:MAG: hypothetical protein MMC33_004783 [Icmadophila ericetorum]|nr:hypothetical protein [Icmadophila ericetorum]